VRRLGASPPIQTPGEKEKDETKFDRGGEKKVGDGTNGRPKVKKKGEGISLLVKRVRGAALPAGGTTGLSLNHSGARLRKKGGEERPA